MFFSDNFGQPERSVDNSTFYNLLGVAKNATTSDIKKSYYKLARTNHPDKGGDVEKFKKIQKAFETLLDNEKRQIYDQYGEEGLQDGGKMPSASSLFELFSGRRRGPRRGRDTEFTLPVSLEEIYNQKTKKLKHCRNVVCTSCRGIGTKSGKAMECPGCKGTGVKIRLERMGMNMMQQSQSTCNNCHGTGEQVLAKNDLCDTCRGRKVCEVKKIIDVLIEKGINSGHKVVFEGQSDAKPGILPGDVIVVMKVKPHATFRREGINLFFKKRITLSEALGGASFSIKHLDDRQIKLDTFGSIVSPGDVRTVINEGMPMHEKSFIKGALFVEFDIEFPIYKSIKDENVQKITKLLNQEPRCEAVADSIEKELTTKSVAEVLASQRNFPGVDEEDEEEPSGRQTTCQTQ